MEGLELYNRACVARERKQYTLARDLFIQAAKAGSGAANWELSHAYGASGGGLCVIESHHKQQMMFFENGAKLGHFACAVQLHCICIEPAYPLPDGYVNDTLALLWLLLDQKGRDERQRRKQFINELFDKGLCTEDPWVEYCIAKLHLLLNKPHGRRESLPWLQRAADKGLAPAQWLYVNVTFDFPPEFEKHGARFALEASNQHVYAACAGVVKSLTGNPTPAEYVNALCVVARKRDNHAYFVLIESFAMDENATDWWRETIVRYGTSEQSSKSQVCASAASRCTRACKDAVYMMCLCLKHTLSKDVLVYIGRMLLREPWLWWKK